MEHLPDLDVASALPAEADAVVLVGPPPYRVPALPPDLQRVVDAAYAADNALGTLGLAVVPVSHGGIDRPAEPECR